jgi:hypothetical protein
MNGKVNGAVKWFSERTHPPGIFAGLRNETEPILIVGK